MREINIYRDFLKSNVGLTDNISDREKKIPYPQLQKNIDKSDTIINLPSINELWIKDKDIYSCIKKRRSRRKFICRRTYIFTLVHPRCRKNTS